MKSFINLEREILKSSFVICDDVTIQKEVGKNAFLNVSFKMSVTTHKKLSLLTHTASWFLKQNFWFSLDEYGAVKWDGEQLFGFDNA